MKRVICIWLPEWPLQRLVVDRPELKSQPLVLHARDARRGQRIVACCGQARELGVRADMPLAELAALKKSKRPASSTGPSAAIVWQIFEHQPPQDHAALAKLAVWCEQFSPIVGLEESEFPDCLLLDVSCLAHLFGGEANLLTAIDEAFRRQGYQVHVAIADSVGAAWALAHYADKPHGVLCEDAAANVEQSTIELLGALPVAALRLPEDTQDTLSQLGVTTISQLLRLPRAGLATRLGSQLVRRIDQALGQEAEVIVAHRPPPEFAAEWPLEHPTDRREILEEILTRLTSQLTQLLARHDHAAVQIEAHLIGLRTTRYLKVGLFQASSNPRHLDALLRLQLETIQMGEPVQRLRLVAVTTVRLTGEQNMLWDDTGNERQLAPLIDRLSSRLGKDNVFRIQSQAGALPERAYREKPLADALSKRQRRGDKAPASLPLHRPLWLQEPPQRLRALSISASTPGDAPPIFFEYQNVRHEVVRSWGPERIETGWWRGPSVRRDYYRVETQAGCRFWLFHRLTDGAWFLHGCFE